jgi:lipoyl synthase
MNAVTPEKSSRIPKRISWNFGGRSKLLAYKNVHTVCEESRCPNRNECSSLGIATFLIGGRECTRACKFCHIATAKPLPLSSIAAKEREDILAAVDAGNYKHLVITSVARDDDEAGLARHFAAIVKDLTRREISVELLIPDFHGNEEILGIIAAAGPTVIAHNMETVRRLSPSVRPQASYERSLRLFDFFAKRHPHIIRKSALMVGLGESDDEISALLDDMRAAGIDVVSIGQYLRPSPEQAAVLKNYSEHEFEFWEREVMRRGFLACESGPFVRSSYMAHETMTKLKAEHRLRQHGSK